MPDRSREPNQSSDPRLPRSSRTAAYCVVWCVSGCPPALNAGVMVRVGSTFRDAEERA